MATNGGRIEFQVGLNVDTKNLDSLKQSLLNIQKIRPMDFSGSKQELNSIKQTATQVEAALKNAFNTKIGSLNVNQFNANLQKMAGGINNIYSQFSKIGIQGQTAFTQIAKNALTANFQLKQTHSIIQQMGTTLVNTIKWNIASSAINSFTQGIQSAFTYVKSLDAALTDIRIVTGDSQQKMEQFAQSANKAAEALGRSTMDYTKSALTFYQQGLSDDQVAARTEAVLKAQNITGAGSEMADYWTAVWNGFKVGAADTQLYMDKLAAVADSSASDMGQLAVAMSKVASTANNMGVNIDQLSAQLATVIATTRQAPEAVGTAFKTIFTRLNDIKTGADEAEISLGNYSGKMAQVGFNVLDANGRLRDTGQIMEEIGSRWETLTKEQQIYLATTMGGQRQVNQLISLFDNWTTYSNLLNISLESEGTLAEKNSRYMESLGAKMNQLATAQERVKSAMVDTDSWKAVLQILTTITSLFGTFIQSIGGGGNALLAFGSILMQVFNGVISKQLNNIIVNLKTIKDNAEIKKQDILNTKLWGDSQGYQQNAVQQMVDAKAQIHKYYQFISAEQANAYNNIVKRVGETAQEVDKTKELVKQTEQFNAAVDAARTKNGFQSVVDSLVQVQKYVEKAKEEIKNLSSMPLNANFKQQSAARGPYWQIYNRLTSYVGKDAVPALKELENQLQKTETDFGKLERAARNALNQIGERTQNSFNLDVLRDQIKEAQSAFQLADGAKKEFLTNIDSQAFSRAITDIVSSVGQLAAGFNSIKNVFKLWDNDNLSAAEKMLQTIMSLSFALPSLYNAYNKLKTAVTSATLSEKAATMESIVNYRKKVEHLAVLRAEEAQLKIKKKTQEGVIVTEKEQAAATELSALADKRKIQTQQALDAQAKLTKASIMGLNTALLVVAGISIAISLWQKYKQSIEDAKKAADDFKEKQKELANNTQNTNNQIKELRELKEEYDKLSEKAGKYDSNISSLTESEKNRWDQIKNKLVSINPEILSAYDAQGKAILNNVDALDKTIEKLQQANRLQLENYVSSEEFRKARKGREERAKEAEEELNTVQGQKANLANMELSSSYGGKLATDELSKILSNNPDSLTSLNEISKILDYSLQDVYDKDANQVQNNLKENFKKIETQLDKEIERLEKKVQQRNPETLFDDKLALQAAKSQQQYLQIFKENNEALLKERFNFVRNLDGQEKAAQSKYDVATQADVTAIKLELTNSTAFNANYEALKAEGMENADAYITAYLQGNKQGYAQNEAELRDKALDFENQLLTFQGNNPEFEAKLKEINQEYKTKTFNSVKERVEWLQEAIQKARDGFDLSGIEDSNDFLTNIFKAVFDINEISLDDQNVTIQDKATEYIEKIFSELKRINPDTDFTIGSLEALLGDNTNFDYILKKLGEIEDGTESQHEKLQQIIKDGNEIAQLSNSITSLSSITQTGEKLQSGQNVSSKDQMAYQKNLDAIIAQEQSKSQKIQNQQLIKDAELLKQTWLAGSEQYEQALARVQKALIDTAVAQAELEGRAFTEEQSENIQRYATTVERVQDLWNRGIIKDQIHYQALLNKAIRQGLKDMKKSPQLLKEYSKSLQQNQKNVKTFVESSGKIRKNLKLTNEEYETLAFNTLKANDAIEKLQKSFKNSKISSKEDIVDQNGIIKPEMIEQVSEMVTFLNEVPGLDINNNQFIKYFDTILGVIHGTEGAMGELRQKLAQEKIQMEIKAGLDDPSIQETLEKIDERIREYTPEEIQTHAYLHDEEFVKMLVELQRKSGEAKRICDAILQSIGAKADVKIKEFKKIPITGRQDFFGQAGDKIAQQFNSMGEMVIPIPEVTFKPLTDEGTAPGSSPSSGGGGGGGGGGGDKGKTLSKKDQKKEDLDPYHDINRQLEKINKQYSLLQKNEEKLIGTGVIDNLNEQNKLLDKNIDLLKQKYDIGEEQRKKKTEPLKAQGVEFDAETGEVTNYNEIRKVWLDQYNELIKEWNKLAEQQTVLTEEQKKEKEEELKEAQKKLEENKKNLEDYINHLDTQADVQLQIKEEEEKKIQNEIKKFKIKIDLHIDFAEAEREWIDFEDKVINQLRDDDIFGNIESKFKNIGTYFETPDGADNSLVQHLTEQVTNTMQQINKMQAGGTSDIYGNNIKQATQDLNNYNKQLQDGLKDYVSLLNEVKQKYYDLANAAQEVFDMQEKRYSSLASWLEHDKKLLELVYGEKAYDKFEIYNKKIIENNSAQLSFHKEQKDFWWARMQSEKARMATLDKDSNAFKEAQDRYKDAEKRWLEEAEAFKSSIQDTAQAIIDNYHNTIDKIFDDLGKKVTNGKGLQPLKEEWQLIKDIQDDYLDNVDKIYEVDKLENAVKDAMKDNQDNPKAQKLLNKFMQDRVDILKQQDKLTQYDIDHANKALEIELKRIALQDSRNNKTKLRLKRDAAGNYSYQFVANEEEGENKLQELKDLQHELYTLDKDKLQEMQDQYLNSFIDFQNKLGEMKKSGVDDSQIASFKDLYLEKLGNAMDTMNRVRQNLPEDMWASVEGLGDILGMTGDQFKELSDAEREEFLAKVVPNWKNGITDMIDTINGEGGLQAVYQDAFGKLNQATSDYEAQLGKLQETAGESFEQLGQGIDDTAEKTKGLITENEGLISTYEDAFTKMGDYIDQVGDLADEYDDMAQAAIQAAQAVRSLNQELSFNGSLSKGDDSNGDSSNDEDNQDYTGNLRRVKKGTPQYDTISIKRPMVKEDEEYYYYYVNEPTQEQNEVHSIPNDGKSRKPGDERDTISLQKEEEEENSLVPRSMFDDIGDDRAGMFSYQEPKETDDNKKGAIHSHNTKIIKRGQKKKVARAATGMYTGEWGNEGKLAILHEKQLVLNKDDTANILSAVDLVRTLSNFMNSITPNFQMPNIPSPVAENKTTLDQNIHITATFPNVQDHNEIEQALNNLINRASQYAFNTDR